MSSFITRRGSRLAACAVVPVAFAVFAAGASAKTVTLGAANASAAQASGYECNGGFSWVQRAVAATTPKYAAPGPGTLTSWSTSAVSSFTGSSAALKVWQPTSNPQQFIPVAQSATESIPNNETLQTYSTSIHVKKGDVIGMYVASSGVACFYFAPTAQSGDVDAYLFGDPTSGTATFTDNFQSPSRLNVSATFLPDCVVPKLTGKTLSAAKDALRDASCTLGKVKKQESSGDSGEVLSQKPDPGTDLPNKAKVSVTVSSN